MPEIFLNETLLNETSLIETLLEELTLDEKIGMIHGDGLFRTKGVPRLGIPAVKLSDGPMGVRHEFKNDAWIPLGYSDDYVTYLPSNSALASTWNRDLAFETGKVLGEETRGRGKDVILAPGINIKRSPLCGRNFEYMSEDPYLAGEMAVPLIEGIQLSDVAACVKHFAINSQEEDRLKVEAEVSDRALREIYLPAFEKAVKQGGALSLMGAYNKYQGEFCCESKKLLKGILRNEWGYDGMVVSDWGAVHDTREVSDSGLDIEMSVTSNFDEYCMAEPMKKAVQSGEMDESLIDEKVRNILRMMERLHMLDPENRKRGCYNTPEHRAAALETARESVVLLKNEEQKLPLDGKKTRKVLVIGDNANRLHSCGGGSAEIKALYEISPLLGIKKLLGGDAEVIFAQGYEADDLEQSGDVNWQADSLEEIAYSEAREGNTDAAFLSRQAELRSEAAALAADASFDAVILVGGQNHQQDLEGRDRPDMKLPYGQDQLIAEVLKARPDTILVMASGSPVEMPWIQEAKTLVWHWYAGMEGGTALAEVLFGEVNPSGKLPESFPICHLDSSAYCMGGERVGDVVKYREGIFAGYRYFDTYDAPVLFPFGYGLSYTQFAYSDLRIRADRSDGVLKVQVLLSVENTGDRAGKEAVQIYIGKKESAVPRARKELKAFTKVMLEPGEKKTVSFELDQEAFWYFDEKAQAFTVEPGVYTVYACKSSAEICLQAECEI